MIPMDSHFIILFSSLLYFILVFPQYSDTSSIRIIGGEEVTRNELPYQVSIQRNNTHICGGSIISENYIVTAAHCFFEPGSYLIVAGEYSLNTNDGTEQIRGIANTKIHPNFQQPTIRNNDIALLKLSSSLTLNDAVAIIPLAQSDVEATGDALVSGWGQTSEDDFTLSDILRKVIVPIISDNRCQSFYPEEIITSSMICAGFNEGGKDSCSKDSGGPLVIGTGSDRYLAGVISWGYGCGRPRQPGVYTEISYFNHWISTEIFD